MISRVVLASSFEKAVEKIRDAGLRERVRKQMAEIVERPDLGKPLRFQRKGERTVWVPPFRIVYALQDDTLYFLDFDKRDRVYR